MWICQLMRKLTCNARLLAVLPLLLVFYIAKNVYQPVRPYGTSAGAIVTDTVAVPTGLKLRVLRWSDKVFTEPDNWRIFFHETSGRDAIHMRQSCAVESAARHNPNRTVQLFVQSVRLNYSSPWWTALSNYPNVQVILLDEREYCKDTPFEHWYDKGVWRTSPFKWAHMADFIRVVSLHRGGGMFLDLDIITKKPYAEEFFFNFFSVESQFIQGISNAVLHLQKGHRLLNDIVELTASRSDNYDPNNYTYYGGEVISDIMAAKCGFIPGRTKHRCKDVHLLIPDFFYPIGNPFLGKLFEAPDAETMAKVGPSYGVHIANSQTQNVSVDLRSDQVYSMLARQNCPFTVDLSLNIDRLI